MIFEKFLKDARQKKGLKQAELANMLFISEKTLSGYETFRRQCTFNFGIEILNKLNLAVLIKDNKIQLVEGDIKMDNNYINTNLDFINFNKEEFIGNVMNFRKKCAEEFEKDFDKTTEILSKKGFDITTTRLFSYKHWLDEHYDSEDKLLEISKDGKTMSLIVTGYLELELFVIERLIELIEEKDKSIAEYIYKSILYIVKTQENGRDIHEMFRNVNMGKIKNTIPMIAQYIDIIEDTLRNNFSEIIATVNYGYNPSEMTIANELNMYDCYSTPYLYYTYTMEDGTEIIDYNPLGEFHDIAEALSYAEAHFEDFDIYKRSYEATISGREDDIERDIVILD